MGEGAKQIKISQHLLSRAAKAFYRNPNSRDKGLGEVFAA